MRGEQSPDDTDLELDRLRRIVVRVERLGEKLRAEASECRYPACLVCAAKMEASRAIRSAMEVP